MSKMHVLNRDGDKEYEWKEGDDLTEAKTAFKKAAADGYFPFANYVEGEPMERIKKFDPNAETIIMTRPLRGG